MHFALTLLIGLALLIAESTLTHALSLDTFTPHVSCALITYVAVHRSLNTACILTILLCALADIIQPGPPAIHSLSLTLLFFTTLLTSKRLSLSSLPALTLYSIVASILLHTFTLLILLAISYPNHIFQTFLFSALPSTLFAPIGMIATFFALQRLDNSMEKSTRTPSTLTF